MSFVANDPFRHWFFQLAPWQAWVFVVVGSPIILWVWEVGRRHYGHDLHRPPFGLGIFEVNAIAIGDPLFLSVTIASSVAFYQSAQVDQGSWLASTSFVIVNWVVAVAVTTAMSIGEQMDRPYQGLWDYLNFGRVFHTGYFLVLCYVVVGFVGRVILGQLTGVRQGGGMETAVGMIFFVLYATTVTADFAKFNPIWKRIKTHYELLPY